MQDHPGPKFYSEHMFTFDPLGEHEVLTIAGRILGSSPDIMNRVVTCYLEDYIVELLYSIFFGPIESGFLQSSNASIACFVSFTTSGVFSNIAS